MKDLIRLSTIPLEGIPTRVRLFKTGPNNTSKGIFNYDPKNIPEIVAKQKNEDGRDLYPIDVAHLSLTDAANPDAHISVGWFELSFEEDGIYANNIEWTPRGKAYLENREFRFISPAFDIRRTDEGKEITYISNFAVTNNPATYNPLPLVASRNEDQSAIPGSNLKNRPKTAPSESESPLAAHSEQVAINKEYKIKDLNKMSDLNVTEEDKVQLSSEEPKEEEKEEEVVAEEPKEEIPEDEKDKMIEDLQAQLAGLQEKLLAAETKLAAFESEVEKAEVEELVDGLALSSDEEKEFFRSLGKENIKKYSALALSKKAKVEEVKPVEEEKTEKEFLSKQNPRQPEQKVVLNKSAGVISLEQIQAQAAKIAAYRNIVKK